MKNKKNSKTILSCAALVSKKASALFANTSCTWWHFEPKKPESVKKLRKF